MKTVEAYGCSYCAMTSRNKHNVIRHERNSCKNNGARITCRTCINLDRDDDGFYCEKTEETIYAPINYTVNCEHFTAKEK